MKIYQGWIEAISWYLNSIDPDNGADGSSAVYFATFNGFKDV
jgi:hypothetical protein